AGSEFGSLPDASKMEIELSLPQLDAQGVRVGQQVRMHPLGRPGDVLTSKLSWVASAAKSRSRRDPVKYLSMRAPVPADAAARLGLVPGQQMRAQVVQLEAEDAITVPNIALRSRGGAWEVRVREGNGAAWRRVELGVRGVSRSQVLSGLAEGDEVLLADAALPDAESGSGDDGGKGEGDGDGGNASGDEDDDAGKGSPDDADTEAAP